jgi:hypothetical protein
MNKRNDDLLEKCIELMETGISVEECLMKYPDLSPEIRDILETTKNVMNLKQEQIPVEKMNLNRSQLLSHAKLLVLSDEQGKSGLRFNRSVLTLRRKLLTMLTLKPFVWRLALVVIITGLFITFSRGLVIASAKSLPGDSLYPIKLAVEDISVLLVRNREVKQQYENNYILQRVDEIKKLIALNRLQRVNFEGIIESQSGTNWVVSGISVILQPDTTLISGVNKVESFKVGSVVEVEGMTNLEGAVTSNEIHLREYQYIGMVETINSKIWQISGIQLLITSKTQIDEGIHVGDNVIVLIRSQDNGLYALAILLEEQPTTTPIQQQSPSAIPMVAKDNLAGNDGQQRIIGPLDKTTDSYRLINGQYVYIGGDPNNLTDIKAGDLISGNYGVEANGSFTAKDIERITCENLLHENEHQSTPEIGQESKVQETSVADSPSNDENDKGTTTPENHETPEPTGEHGDSP